MNIIPVGGKTPNNTAAAVAVDANGKLDTKKTWDVETQSVEKSLRSTSGTSTMSTVIDCSGFAMVSLRIINLHKDGENNKLPIHVMIQSDHNDGTSEVLHNLDGELTDFYVPYGVTIVTPEDFPPLKYMRLLKFYLKSETVAPTTGSITIYVIKKR